MDNIENMLHINFYSLEELYLGKNKTINI